MKSLLVIFLFSVSVFAADPPTGSEADQNWMKYSKPAAGHKALNDLEGTWKYTMTWKKDSKATPMKEKGTATTKWILGGRYLQQDVTSKTKHGPFHGIGFTGFDNIRQEYQTVWLDNMSTGMMLGNGTLDAETKTMKTEGDVSCPMTSEKHRSYRTELKIESKAKHTFTMFMKDDGGEYEGMVITYTK